MIEITPLREDDRQAWQPLAVGYNTFYERVMPDADLRPRLAPPDGGRRSCTAWPRGSTAASSASPTISSIPTSGSTRSATSPTCSSTRQVRGQGAARLLIEAVADRRAPARLPALLLADAAAQCPRPRPLRQGGALRGLHPLRLSAEPVLTAHPGGFDAAGVGSCDCNCAGRTTASACKHCWHLDTATQGMASSPERPAIWTPLRSPKSRQDELIGHNCRLDCCTLEL